MSDVKNGNGRKRDNGKPALKKARKPTKTQLQAAAAEAKRTAEEAARRAAELEAEADSEPPDEESETEAQLRADRARDEARERGVDVDARDREIIVEMTPTKDETGEQRTARLARLRAVRERYGVPYDAAPDEADIPEGDDAAKQERLAKLRDAVRLAQSEGRREPLRTVEREDAPVPEPATESGAGGGEPPAEPPSAGGDGDDEIPLQQHYDEVKKRAGRFLRNGHDFLDDIYPFLKRIMEVRWHRPGSESYDGAIDQGYANFPVHLNVEGQRFMVSKGLPKPRGFSELPQHITPIIKHFMSAHTDVNIKEINSGVTSQFSSLIHATFVLPRMIAAGTAKRKDASPLTWKKPPTDKEGTAILPDEMLPSMVIKALGGTNPTLKAWRDAANPPRTGETEQRIPESEVEERVDQARREAAEAIERQWSDERFAMRDDPDIATVDADAAPEIREGQEFALIGFRVGTQLHIKRVRPLNVGEA